MTILPLHHVPLEMPARGHAIHFYVEIFGLSPCLFP